MGKPTGFMEFERLSEGYLPVAQAGEKLPGVRAAPDR